LGIRLKLLHVFVLVPPLTAHGTAGHILDGVPISCIPDRQPHKRVAEAVDRMRGHVRSAFRIVGPQRNADGDRRTGDIDELLQSLEVIRSDRGLLTVLRLLALGRPERPPVEGIAGEPQRRRPERSQLLVEIRLRRVEPWVGKVGGFEGDPDVVGPEARPRPFSGRGDRCGIARGAVNIRLLEFSRSRARLRGLARGRRIVRIEPRTPRQNEGERHHATLDTPSEVHANNSALSPQNQQLPQSLSRHLHRTSPRRQPTPPRQPSSPNPHPPRHPPRGHGIVVLEITPPEPTRGEEPPCPTASPVPPSPPFAGHSAFRWRWAWAGSST